MVLKDDSYVQKHLQQDAKRERRGRETYKEIEKLSDYCKLNTSCTRAHSMTLVPPQSTINSYRFSFFVNTAFLWNTVPYDIVTLSAPKF